MFYKTILSVTYVNKTQVKDKLSKLKVFNDYYIIKKYCLTYTTSVIVYTSGVILQLMLITSFKQRFLIKFKLYANLYTDVNF